MLISLPNARLIYSRRVLYQSIFAKPRLANCLLVKNYSSQDQSSHNSNSIERLKKLLELKQKETHRKKQELYNSSSSSTDDAPVQNTTHSTLKEESMYGVTNNDGQLKGIRMPNVSDAEYENKQKKLEVESFEKKEDRPSRELKVHDDSFCNNDDSDMDAQSLDIISHEGSFSPIQSSEDKIKRKEGDYQPGDIYDPSEALEAIQNYHQSKDKESRLFSFRVKNHYVDIFKQCKYSLHFAHKNTFLLSQFISPNGKILPKRINKLSAKSQRQISKCIRRAQQMALVPYLSRRNFVPPDSMN